MAVEEGHLGRGDAGDRLGHGAEGRTEEQDAHRGEGPFRMPRHLNAPGKGGGGRVARLCGEHGDRVRHVGSHPGGLERALQLQRLTGGAVVPLGRGAEPHRPLTAEGDQTREPVTQLGHHAGFIPSPLPGTVSR